MSAERWKDLLEAILAMQVLDVLLWDAPKIGRDQRAMYMAADRFCSGHGLRVRKWFHKGKLYLVRYE